MWHLKFFVLVVVCSLAKSLPPLRHVGQLSSNDLADLLIFSMETRGEDFTEEQEKIVYMLRHLQVSQDNLEWLELDPEVVISLLLGERQNANCDDIVHNNAIGKARLKVELKSFLALCNFNNIKCTRMEVARLVKITNKEEIYRNPRRVNIPDLSTVILNCGNSVARGEQDVNLENCISNNGTTTNPTITDTNVDSIASSNALVESSVTTIPPPSETSELSSSSSSSSSTTEATLAQIPSPKLCYRRYCIRRRAPVKRLCEGDCFDPQIFKPL